MALPADLVTRLSQARTDRSKRRAQINEYYDFADPARPRVGDSTASTTTDRAHGVVELYDSTLMEVHEDFASDVIDRVMPRSRNWVDYEPDEALPEEIAVQLKEEFESRTTKIFSAIRQSNFYDEAAGEWAGDLAHGTAGVACVDYGAARPLCFEAIPPAQLLIGRGPGGSTAFRAREYAWPIEDAVAYWPTYKWPAALMAKARNRTSKRQPVVIGESATLIPDPGGERWNWRVTVNNEHLIHEEEVEGRGSCPIIVTRWRTYSSSAWGVGPGIKCLPDTMTLNQERRLILKNLGKRVDPPTSYEDDGVMNPEGGVEAGDWIPRLPGSKPPEQLKQEGVIEAAYYEQGGLQDAIRRALYQYGPRQRGKTPPTFGQWMDEKTEEGRRLELPTGKVYAEGVIAVLERVEYLLTKRGDLDPAITSAGGKLIHYRPRSPFAKQQAAEDVSQTNQILTMVRAIFGDQVVAAIIDGTTTIENIVKALGDKNIVLRKPDQAAEYLRGVLGQPGQAPGLETAPGEAGPSEAAA